MTTRRRTASPRKPPQQQRSRETVSAVLDATIRIFEQEGPEAATTSRIAEVAGVSVGTLYQYFANRDAILDALQAREFERASELMQRLLFTEPRLSERELARRVVAQLLALYRAAPALHCVLAVEGLRVTPTERVHAFDRHIVDTIRRFLPLLGGKLRRRKLEASAFVIYQSVRATMLAYMLERPPEMEDADVVEELSDLIVRYLIRANDSET
jgi:AcrR family transcriptional regulator